MLFRSYGELHVSLLNPMSRALDALDDYLGDMLRRADRGQTRPADIAMAQACGHAVRAALLPLLAAIDEMRTRA